MSNVDLQITAENTPYFKGMPEPVLRIQICRIHMFLDLPDPHPDLLVKDMDPDSDPDPSIKNNTGKKNLDKHKTFLKNLLTFEGH
jgi:hypothetical protein